MCARQLREKQIKGWLRTKKIALIESLNPRWADLAEHWDGIVPESRRSAGRQQANQFRGKWIGGVTSSGSVGAGRAGVLR